MSPGGRPALLAACRPVHVDVRDDIRRGVEPFARIMAAVKGMGEGDALVLRAPFEPLPLYGVLARRGLAHWTERRADDDWSVWFYREPAADAGPTPAADAGPATAGTAGERGGDLTIDVRGLPPPLPMVRVLEHLDELPAGARLEVIHDRRPMFLYPQLDERGCAHETDEPEPGVVRIRIAKRPQTER